MVGGRTPRVSRRKRQAELFAHACLSDELRKMLRAQRGVDCAFVEVDRGSTSSAPNGESPAC